MDRREFLRRAMIIAGGAIAADQLEILERLTARKIFPSPFPRGIMGEIQLLDGYGRIDKHIPYNGERLIEIMNTQQSAYRWMRLMLNSPAEGTVIASMGVPPGGMSYTLPLDMNAPARKLEIKRLIMRI